MNHIPYEDWLLSGEALDPSQEAELKEHLASCESCQELAQAWQSVAATIQTAPEMVPAPGFTERWQEKLIKAKAARQRRLTWLILVLCLGGALASLAGIIFLNGSVSGVAIMTALLQGISQAFSTGDAVIDGARDLFVRLPIGVTLIVWIIIASSLCFWSLIWFTFVWRLPRLRRNNNEAYH